MQAPSLRVVILGGVANTTDQEADDDADSLPGPLQMKSFCGNKELLPRQEFMVSSEFPGITVLD